MSSYCNISSRYVISSTLQLLINTAQIFFIFCAYLRISGMTTVPFLHDITIYRAFLQRDIAYIVALYIETLSKVLSMFLLDVIIGIPIPQHIITKDAPDTVSGSHVHEPSPSRSLGLTGL